MASASVRYNLPPHHFSTHGKLNFRILRFLFLVRGFLYGYSFSVRTRILRIKRILAGGETPLSIRGAARDVLEPLQLTAYGESRLKSSKRGKLLCPADYIRLSQQPFRTTDKVRNK